MNAEMSTVPGAPGIGSSAHASASRRILAAILVTMFVSGLMSGLAEQRHTEVPAWWSLLSAVLLNFLTFCWFRLDRDARGIRRSVWANIAILLLGPVVIVVYLLVRRPGGDKLRSLARLAGFFVLLVLAVSLGMMVAAVIA